jgi:predicted DNA-binding WGR domain protein
MKLELEYTHDATNSKVWLIELKSKKIIIKFGKKNATLQEKIITFKSDDDAKKEYDKRVKDKINKGYEKIGVKKEKIDKGNVKIGVKKEKIDKGNLKSKELNIQLINPILKYFLSILQTYCTFQEKIYRSLSGTKDDYDDFEREKIYSNKLDGYVTKITPSINKKLENIQKKKCSSFTQSGIINKVINNKIKLTLLECINQFKNTKKLDYHPGSNNKVLDIVHPSLYPLIKKVKKNHSKFDFWKRTYESSNYQWLPSEFKITSDRKCKISSYINNLPIGHTEIYEQLELLFESILPEFENMWSYINCYKLYDTEDAYLDIKKNDGKYKQLYFTGQTLQIITKIVEISLGSNQTLDGAWHVEGMSHENIVATATCTLNQDSAFQTSLYFKRTYSAVEAGQIVDSTCQNPCQNMKNLLNNILIPLGKVNIKTNSLVVFPNSHIHKVDMKNNSTKKQTRTIVVFWLINPNIKIISTKDIKQQSYVIKDAHKHRLKLMEERTFYKQSFNQRDLNLCEH